MSMFDDINDFIGSSALYYKIDEKIVKSIIVVESSGKTYAQRYEPNYIYLWDCKSQKPYMLSNRSKIPDDFYAQAKNGSAMSTRETEFHGQKTSWGLMQVMGAVAREYGFDGYLAELCIPNIGIDYGCRHFSSYVKRYRHSQTALHDAIAAYNAGSAVRMDDGKYRNQVYVDKVLFQLTKI